MMKKNENKVATNQIVNQLAVAKIGKVKADTEQDPNDYNWFGIIVEKTSGELVNINELIEKGNLENILFDKDPIEQVAEKLSIAKDDYSSITAISLDNKWENDRVIPYFEFTSGKDKTEQIRLINLDDLNNALHNNEDSVSFEEKSGLEDLSYLRNGELHYYEPDNNGNNVLKIPGDADYYETPPFSKNNYDDGTDLDKDSKKI